MHINNAMLAEMHWIKTSPYSSATEKTQFLEVFNELNKNLSHDLLPKVEDTNRKINVHEINWQSYIYFNDWKKPAPNPRKFIFWLYTRQLGSHLLGPSSLCQSLLSAL